MTPGESTRRERVAWCLYDFANSPFSTIIITFVYVNYFVGALVGDEVRGETLWSWMVAVSGVLIALLSPLVGSLADRRGLRRELLVATSIATVAFTALLWFPAPSMGEAAIWFALGLVMLANVGFEVAFALYNSFLPQLGNQATMGRLSGVAWAVGYFGGLVCLVVALLGFIGVGGAAPWFAISTEGGAHVRATVLLVAGWFVLFALPMLVFVPERHGALGAETRLLGGGVRAVLRTLAELRGYPDLLRLFIARLFYNDGLLAIFTLAALYMKTTLGMTLEQVMMVGIGSNVAAGVGALGFGFLEDRIGARRTIILSLVLLIGGAVVAFAFPTPGVFWVAACVMGLGMGPNQSSSRTLVARFIDPARSAEFYGLFALSGKATVWLGPALFALIRPHVEDQRIAFLPIVGLMVVGLVLVLGVDERRGIARVSTAPGTDA